MSRRSAPARRFEEPTPPTPDSRAERARVAAAMRTRPGQWLLYGARPSTESARQMARSIRRGELDDFPAGDFEANSRTICGEYRVYVRYVGGDHR